jgi:hypothetical protein
MRWIKKELDEEGKPEWAVYIDNAGEGNQEEWSHFDTYKTRDDAVKACWRFTWEDYDCSDK